MIRSRVASSAIVAVLFVAASPSMTAAPAAADADAGSIEATASRTNRGVSVTVVESGRTLAVGTQTLSECRYLGDLNWPGVVDLVSDGDEFGRIDPLDGPDRAEATFVVVICPQPVLGGLRWVVWVDGESVPADIGESLAREARASVEVPLPTPLGAPDGTVVPQLVNLASWWWLADEDWRAVEATASFAGGGPSVTARLAPLGAVWSVEGHEPVECGQGRVWEPGMTPSTDGWCGTVFTETSGPDGVEQAVTVTFGVSLLCVPASMCARIRPLDPVMVTTRSVVHVVQARGVLLS